MILIRLWIKILCLWQITMWVFKQIVYLNTILVSFKIKLFSCKMGFYMLKTLYYPLISCNSFSGISQKSSKGNVEPEATTSSKSMNGWTRSRNISSATIVGFILITFCLTNGCLAFEVDGIGSVSCFPQILWIFARCVGWTLLNENNRELYQNYKLLINESIINKTMTKEVHQKLKDIYKNMRGLFLRPF